MRLFCGFAAACVLLTLSATSNAAPITTLKNTGIGAGGLVLANGGAEINYTLVSQPLGSSSSLIAVTSAGGFPVPPWLGDSPDSAWIRPDNPYPFQGDKDNDPAGMYVYETKFDMTGFIRSTASITGRWSTDNPGLYVTLNGNAIDPGTSTGAGSFDTWTNFSFAASGLNIFVDGLNTLRFYVNNVAQSSGNPTGLRVEMTGNAVLVPEQGPEAVPLPASLVLLVTGIPGLGLVLRRLRKTAK